MGKDEKDLCIPSKVSVEHIDPFQICLESIFKLVLVMDDSSNQVDTGKHHIAIFKHKVLGIVATLSPNGPVWPIPILKLITE